MKEEKFAETEQLNYSYASLTDFTETKVTAKNVKSFPSKYGAYYPSVGLMGYGLAIVATSTSTISLAGDISEAEMKADGKTPADLKSAGKSFLNSVQMGYYPLNFATPLAHSTRRGMPQEFGGIATRQYPYSACGNNNTFMIGNIATENEDLESYMFFTGSDYRYNNTGLNLP